MESPASWRTTSTSREHVTAQQTKATGFAIGQIAGPIAGAIIGAHGQVIAQGSQFGLGTYFLKYGREYEKQSDILGSRIMAGAGYDPRDMANVFRTIEKESGPGGPQWMSSHPNPGNRYEYINKEAQSLRVSANVRRNTPEFQQAKSYLGSMNPALSAEEVARNKTAAARIPAGATCPTPVRPGLGARPYPETTYN